MNSRQALAQINQLRYTILTYQKVSRYYNTINSVCYNYRKASAYARKLNDLNRTLSQINQIISIKK